jgi:hypothetical protein
MAAHQTLYYDYVIERGDEQDHMLRKYAATIYRVPYTTTDSRFYFM